MAFVNLASRLKIKSCLSAETSSVIHLRMILNLNQMVHREGGEPS